jgi:polysaccharide deacetylase family protein (PEP-CTERM system associated)
VIPGASENNRDEIVNAMTVDVEDYFHVSAFERVVSRAGWDAFDSRVVANTNLLLELFNRAGVRSTFFVLGWVAERFPALVRQIASAGHEVASHGYHHQLVYLLTPEQFRDDVRSAKRAIENATGTPVLGFRAPSYSVTASSLWALDVLVEEGYVYDASIFPIHHDRYGIPSAPRHAHLIEGSRGTLVEMPGSTVRIGGVNLPVAGGGYFRLLPYAWTRWGIRRVNRMERAPVIFYVHPWEVDPQQPRMNVGGAARLRHYTGLNRTARRLTRLLKDFRFDTVASALATMPRAQQWPAQLKPAKMAAAI